MPEQGEAVPRGLRFSIISRFVRRRMDELLRENELTGVQLGVIGRLMALEKAGEEVNLRELEKAAHTSHANMTEIVKRLEKQGLVLSKPSEKDRRAKAIASTEKARQLHEELEALDGRIFDELCRGLDAEEIQTLLRLTDRLLENACAGAGKGDGEPC